MNRVLSVAFAVLICSSAIIAAQNPPQMPKPGPEHKNLEYFVGTWKTNGELHPGPMGPGGKYTGTDKIEWMPGGFFLVSHTQASGPGAMGNVTGLAIYGYDTEKKAYSYDEFNSSGEAVHATGQFDGKVWTWTSDLNMGGKTMKSHFILTETSPTAYTFKFEVSEDGNNWATVVDGSGTKVSKAGGGTKKKK
jgi:Protein of unknown function (DUF1579)